MSVVTFLSRSKLLFAGDELPVFLARPQANPGLLRSVLVAIKKVVKFLLAGAVLRKQVFKQL